MSNSAEAGFGGPFLEHAELLHPEMHAAHRFFKIPLESRRVEPRRKRKFISSGRRQVADAGTGTREGLPVASAPMAEMPAIGIVSSIAAEVCQGASYEYRPYSGYSRFLRNEPSASP